MKMRFTKKVYLACAVVMLLSLILALLFPTREILQSILATPGAAALVLALWQLLRDEASFAKERLLKQEERIHALGVSSHMAEVAFDKHGH